MGIDGAGARLRDAAPRGQDETTDLLRTTGDAGPSEGILPVDDDEDLPTRPRRVLRRVLISVSAIGLVLALLVGGAVWFLTERYAGNIDRIDDVFADLDDNQRPESATGANPAGESPVTFLLVGSDSREKTPKGQDPGARSDAIMIARFSGDRQHAQLISIPRDSWVDIPGHGKNKINASYALGGPSLLIQTVEQLTDVRIDHYVAIDFDGIARVTDDLGGVDVVVAEETSNGGYTFRKGVNHLDGDQARWYLGQRYGLPGGDFDRVRRQQHFLKAVYSKLISAETFTDPSRMDAAMLTLTGSVTVDDTLSNADVLALARAMRGLTPANLETFTAPVLGTGHEGPASVVYLDDVLGERMWQYLRNDSLGENSADFRAARLSGTPR
jgi:LCP family protein required for cell wall assembly